MKGNVIVGQSGGPTAAINSSLAGVYRTARDRGAGKVYGMLHGIQGLLQERYIDLSEYITSDLDVLHEPLMVLETSVKTYSPLLVVIFLELFSYRSRTKVYPQIHF